MRQVFSISLAFIMMLQCSMKLIVVAHFEANRKYIAQNLCENKSKPEQKCSGTCYLKKQLKKEEKNESANNVLKIKVETLFVEKIFQPVFEWIISVAKPEYAYLGSIKVHYFLFVFKPPKMISFSA